MITSKPFIQRAARVNTLMQESLQSLMSVDAVIYNMAVDNLTAEETALLISERERLHQVIQDIRQMKVAWDFISKL